MRVISTKFHGYVDYIVGVLLIAAPWIFGFYAGGAESWVPIILGAGTIFYSILTDYELGMTRVIPMKTHLFLDLIAGIFLAASSWLFGFADYVYLPHLLVGILEIGFSAMTHTESYTSRQAAAEVHHA